MPGGNEMAWFLFFIAMALKSSAVLGVAWALALAMRKRSAAARHLVWAAAATSVLALPLLSILLPALRIPASPEFLAAPAASFQTAVIVLSSSTIEKGSPGRPVVLSKGSRPRADWKTWLMLLWAAGTAVALVQMLVACAAVWRIRRSARPAGDRELELCAALSRMLGIHRRVDVLRTAAGSMPMTLGVLRSAVLIPSDAAEWSEERRRIVLLHELAHVRRGDVATNLLARTALALYWWNPLAWKAWREFLKEGERATDDLVLNSGASAADYAGHLLAVARAMQAPRGLGWAAVGMARRSQLEGRLAAILDSTIRRKTPGRGSVFLAALAAVAVMTPLAALKAQDQRAQDTSKPPVPAAGSQNSPQTPEDAAKAAEQQRKYDAYWVSIGGKLGPQDKEQQLKQALAAGEPMTDLPLMVEVDRFRMGPAAYFVPVSLQLLGAVLLPAAKAGSSTAEFDFIGQIQDETGAAAGAVRDKITIKLKPETGQSGHKIQYDSGFTLAPGRYTLKLLARENVSGQMGTFESRFIIPDQSADSPELKLSTVVFSNQRVHGQAGENVSRGQSADCEQREDHPQYHQSVPARPDHARELRRLRCAAGRF